MLESKHFSGGQRIGRTTRVASQRSNPKAAIEVEI